jgi:hypothetical protein
MKTPLKSLDLWIFRENDPCDAKIARHRRRHRQRLRIFCWDACWGVGVHVTSKQVTYHAKLTWKFRKTNMLLWIIITKKTHSR